MRQLLGILAILTLAGYAVAAIEAETGELGPEVQVVTMDGASGGKAIMLGGDRHMKEPGEKPDAVYAFEMKRKGSRSATARVLSTAGSNNSMYVSIDDSEAIHVGSKAQKEWQDTALGTWKLEAGKHTLRIWRREPGMVIDQIDIAARSVAKALVAKYPMPEIVPPPEHPRVLVRKCDLDTVRRNRTIGENAAAWKRVQELAATDSDKIVAKVKLISSSRHDATIMEAMRAKALVYLLDGDEKMGRDAVDLATRVMEKQVFKKGKDVTRPIGSLLEAGALVYDWCYPLMNDEQRRDFIGHFEALGSIMEIGYPPFGQGAVTGHAGEAQLMRDALSAAIAVYDEYPDMYRMAAGRFFAEFIAPRNWFYPSGRHHQGDGYGRYRYQWEIYSAWLFRRMAGVDVFDATQVRVPYGWIYSRRPDGMMFRVGDSGRPRAYSTFQLPAMLAANFYRDTILKGEFLKQGTATTVRSTPVLMLLVNDPNLLAESHETLPLTRYNGGPLPSMQIRTGWNLGMSSRAVAVDLWGAHTHFNNHDHLDAGNFQIYYRGALAHDPGVYGGSYGNAYDFSFNKRTISHNCMLVYDPDEKLREGRANDGGQRFPNGGREPRTLDIVNTPEFRNGEVLAHDFGPNKQAPFYSYMSVDLGAAYTDKVDAYTRTFVFLNLDRPGNPGALIVLDRVKSAKAEFKKTWVLHTPEKPMIGAGTVDIRNTESAYNGRLFVTSLLPEERKTTLVGGIGEKVDVFGKTYELPQKKAESPGWRVQISPIKATREDTFLNLMQILDAEGPDLLDCSFTERSGSPDSDYYKIAIADRVVLLPKTDKPFAGPVDFEIKGKGTYQFLERYQFLATGLAPGDWEIGPLGKKAKWHTTVTNEAGTAFFVLKPGKWELRPGSGGRVAPTYDELRPKPEKPRKAGIAVGNAMVSLDEPIERVGDHALLPIGRIVEAGGAKVKIKGDTLTTTLGKDVLTMRAGESSYELNGQSMETDAPIAKHGGDLYGPPYAVAQLLRMWYRDYREMDEMVFYKPAKEDRPSHWILRIDAKGPKSLRPPRMAQDGDFGSIWSCSADRVDLEMDLGDPQSVSCVSVAWSHGNARKEFFSIEVSDDGKTWRQVWSGTSSGTVEGFEDYTFDSVKTRYVRLVCRGNSKSRWNSIRELRVREK